MRFINVAALILLIVGGLNWGLVGLAEFDLVATLFGGSTVLLAQVVSVLVALAAVYQAVALKSVSNRWAAKAVPA